MGQVSSESVAGGVARYVSTQDFLKINKGIAGMGMEHRLSITINPRVILARMLAKGMDVSMFIESRDAELLQRIDTLNGEHGDDGIGFLGVESLNKELKILEAERKYLGTFARALIEHSPTT